MKTILIAGGCGFIGSNLCNYLLNKNNKIICVDNLFSGKMENIKSCIDNDNFTFINHNIIEPIHIDSEVNEIYHLACPASPPVYQKDPIYTLKTNFIGTMNLLELARIKSSKILLASTSEIYGEPEISPQPETYRGNVNTIGIRSCYDEGKRIAETLFMDYNKKYKVNTRIVRIFNTYGPNMNPNDGRVISNFINQCINSKDITIFGDGSQTRSFCYIDDMVDGLIKLMNSDQTGPINIGNPNEMTIKETALLIKEKTNSVSKIIFKELPSDDPLKRKPDITKAKKYLDWEPKIDINEGLEKTITYYRELKVPLP